VERIFFPAGAIAGLFGVLLGAFAAHALKTRLPEDLLQVFEVGVRYQMYHALALLAVAWACLKWPGPLTSSAGWLFIAGIVVFSGSLYVLSFTGIRWLGAITPVGGLAFAAGWICLALAAWKG
jgi:uncharacterized membrane protein YgdD (TMEM256/DUF423 family)